MRELKFRAWDKKRKRMFAVATLNASGAVSVFIDDDGLYLLPAEQIELMQYTGLKDKNGKEIYEGDIVKAPIYGVWTTGNSDAIFGDKIWKLSVIWSDADCGFLFKVIGSKNQPNRVYDMLDQHLGAFEVIGNIHESNMEELCPKE